MNYGERFRVNPGSKVKLGDFDPNITVKHEDQGSARSKLEKYARKLHDLQYLLYAEGNNPCSSACRDSTAPGRTARSTMCSQR